MDEVVVGATRKDLVATIVDDNGAIVNLAGGSVSLQGRSNDLPAKTINVAGTLTNPAQGQVTFSQIGTLVTHTELSAASVSGATFRLRLKFTDSTSEFDFGPLFELRWVDDPLYLPA